ncbi:uncharacterized protein LOC143020770 isoform X2 [Oratosquilla oratoria]|uniref:uncharacterized protein LOC143020770 isoform X2 n=1 Tax=Oratosquilla oratoria TaxID=337810 RepID=UPI003F776FD2
MWCCYQKHHLILQKTMHYFEQMICHSSQSCRQRSVGQVLGNLPLNMNQGFGLWKRRPEEMYTKQMDLSGAQKRVVQKFLLESRLNGIELPPEQARTFNSILKRLEYQKSLYVKKVMETTNNFIHHIRDPSMMRDFPLDLVKAMALDKHRAIEGPWAVTLDPQIYDGFMTHCPNQSLRFNVWRAYNVRASNHISKDVNNSLHIEEIRSSRREQATILGYKDFVEMSMETKMAGSVENVLSMITSLVAKAKGEQIRELESLQAFAESRGFDGELQIYDVPYWRNKERRAKLNYDEAHLSEYFPFEHVLVKMLELSATLFGVSYEQVPREEVSLWHEDVRFFNILDADDGSYLASFYLDPFQRPGAKLHNRVDSAWMLGSRSRSDVAGTTPVASLVFNFAPPQGDRPALLTFRDVNILFQKFGHALQHLLTTVPYSEASGLTNIEWDAVDICAHFFHNWLYEQSTLEDISSHYESGMPLKGSSVEDLMATRSHMAAYDLCSALYLSHLDLALHTHTDFWQDIVRELWDKYRPFPMDKYDSHLCSQTSIMADVWTAAYYSHTWSRMVAADAFQAFKEDEDGQNIQQIGRRFRDTFLSLGGGSHPSEVFRRFRGRDPSPEALLHFCGITGKGK